VIALPTSPPPKPGETTCDVAEYILMAPSNFFALLMIECERFDVKPGDYTLIIQYQSIMPNDLAPKPLFPLPYWTRENKPLVSKLHISVTP